MKYLLTLLLLILPLAAQANTTITALPTIPSPGVVLGTSVLALDQNSTGTLTTYQASMNTISSFVFSAVNPVCSISGMPTVCGSFFGFVLPNWYGGFCDANWDTNNNFHDDSAAIQTALGSGYPVYIYHCKIAAPVQYTVDHGLLMSFSNIVTNDTFEPTNDFAPGGIFLPDNLGQLCAIDQNGWSDIGINGLHLHANNQPVGSAGLCNTHSNRDGLVFWYITNVSVQNMGMAFGGPTDSTGIPVIGNTTNIGCPDGTVTSYGCGTQVQISNFSFAHVFWGIRANFSDNHFINFYIANTKVAIASYNRFTGGASFTDGRIEFNGGGSSIGTSALYPQGDATVAGVVSAGGFASWDMSNVQFEQNSSPNVDVEGGGGVTLSGGHVYSTNNALAPVDSMFYIGTGTTGGGSLLISNMFMVPNTSHPAYGIAGGSLSNGGTHVSVVNSYASENFGATANFNWSVTPNQLYFQVLGQPIYDHGSSIGVRIGTNAPVSGVDIGTQGLGIGSSYGGIVSAPLNGAIIQGNVGIGTTNPLGPLEIGGLATTAPIGTTTGALTLCIDSNNVVYKKASCP